MGIFLRYIWPKVWRWEEEPTGFTSFEIPPQPALEAFDESRSNNLGCDVSADRSLEDVNAVTIDEEGK